MTPSARFHNRSAVFLWILAAAWLLLLAVFTCIFHRDGTPAGHSNGVILAVLILFWMSGAWLASLVASRPLLVVTADGADGIRATWRFPHRVVRRAIGKARLRPAQVVDSEDSDGNPYYFARVHATEGESIDLKEGRDRQGCENACARFNDAVFGKSSGVR